MGGRTSIDFFLWEQIKRKQKQQKKLNLENNIKGKTKYENLKSKWKQIKTKQKQKHLNKYKLGLRKMENKLVKN